MPRKMKEYALYKGDELLGVGNVHELAKLIGVSEKTIYWYSSPAARRRNTGGDAKIAEVIG